VAGFIGTKEVAVASFTFTPPVVPPPISVPQILATLDSSFQQKLTNVTFSVPNPAVQVIAADDVVVAMYKS
jgi:hypothetical protein